MTLAPKPADVERATDRLFAEAFSSAALVTAETAARLLGLDDKTFRALAKEGVVPSVRVSLTAKRFAEADLRAFITRERELPACRSSGSRRAPTTNTTSSTKVVGITDLRARRLSATPAR